jgi:hypothetical protein
MRNAKNDDMGDAGHARDYTPADVSAIGIMSP